MCICKKWFTFTFLNFCCLFVWVLSDDFTAFSMHTHFDFSHFRCLHSLNRFTNFIQITGIWFIEGCLMTWLLLSNSNESNMKRLSQWNHRRIMTEIAFQLSYQYFIHTSVFWVRIRNVSNNMQIFTVTVSSENGKCLLYSISWIVICLLVKLKFI